MTTHPVIGLWLKEKSDFWQERGITEQVDKMTGKDSSGKNGIDKGMRYDILVEAALRRVVQDVLAAVGKDGLAGEQHFYITFRTSDPNVQIPDYLRSRYPVEMTIVLQYQFYGLEVVDNAFQVTLTFNNVPERLIIPISSITVFADPSVNFALQFQSIEAEEEDTATVATVPVEKDKTAPKGDADADNGEKVGEVVSLDSFRKKT